MLIKRLDMKYGFFLLFIMFSVKLFAQIDDKINIVSLGKNRLTYLHEPKGANAVAKRPLIIALHAGGQTAKEFMSFTKFNRYSDRDTVYVAYPAAIDQHWNDGRIIPGDDVSKYANDVQFISDLIDFIIKNKNVDAERVYVTGLANGALMCYRLACEIPQKIAAIAPVAGSIASEISTTCSPVNVLNIIAINGEDDPIVPYKGGKVTFEGKDLGNIESVEKTINFFANYGSEIKASSIKVKKKDFDHTDRTTLITESYTNAKYLSEVVLYTVKGGGHAWTGASQYLPPSTTGNVSREFDTSFIIWEFFMNVY